MRRLVRRSPDRTMVRYLRPREARLHRFAEAASAEDDYFRFANRGC